MAAKDAKYSKIGAETSDEEQGDGKVKFEENAQPNQSSHRMNQKKKLLIGSLVSVTLAVICLIILIVILSKEVKPYVKQDMAVASDNPVCTNIGGDILRQGGGSVDAMIAVLLCLGACQPQSNGIGGGGFMLVHNRTDNKVINFRELAPAASTELMFYNNRELATVGGKSVGIPGEIRGYETAHKMFGRLPWADLFTPSIAILNEGINVTAHLANALKLKQAQLEESKGGAYFKEVWVKDGVLLKEGDTYVNKRLAACYQRIAEKGAVAFYKGAIAKNSIKAMKPLGVMTEDDLEDYHVVVTEPLIVNYRGHKIYTVPPPASGHVVSAVLKILNYFTLPHSDSTSWFKILEAFRHGYALRSQTGDIEMSNRTQTFVENLKRHNWGWGIAEPLSKQSEPAHNISFYGDVYTNYDGTHTTHVSILGPDDEACSCTSTVNLYFGSTIMTENGFFLNNEMDDFSTPGMTNAFGFPPSPENYIKAGKRPLSSSSPVIMVDRDKRPRFVSGAAGGSRIITGALLSIINALDWNMSLKDNLASKRIHDQLTGKTFYEEGVSAELLSNLTDLGYNMTLKAGYMSVVTSVSSLGDKVEAVGDPRKGGSGIVIPVE